MKLMHGTFYFFTKLNITYPYQKINYFGKLVAEILEGIGNGVISYFKMEKTVIQYDS